MYSQRRFTLLPCGDAWPKEDVSALSLKRLLNACGSDPGQPPLCKRGVSVEEYILSFGSVITQHSEREFIIGINQTRTMGEVLACRAWLEGEFPFLAQAFWVLFVNDTEELRFMLQLNDMGSMDAEILEGAPMWTPHVTPGKSFLVCTTHTWDVLLINMRARMHFEPQAKRPTVPAPSDPSSVRVSGIRLPLAPRTPSFAGLRLEIPKTPKPDE
ncbi:MAG: hypothetical protein ABIO72_01325 [Patescibacteria group bacterium]